MANNIIRRTWKQGGMVNIEDLRGSAFQAEDGGHTFLISGVDENGDALALSGTPAGVLLRADGQDVTLTCSVSDGVVSATLPANAYVVPGRIGITIFLTNGGQKTAIYAAIAAVATTSSGTVAPPAGSDVVDLVNAIATAVATIPASYTDLMAAVAPTYSTSALYAVGSYAWYNGKLYRCTTAITSGETWTSGHWTQANLGSDVSDLKSAISGVEEYIPWYEHTQNLIIGYYNNSGTLVETESGWRSTKKLTTSVLPSWTVNPTECHIWKNGSYVGKYAYANFGSLPPFDTIAFTWNKNNVTNGVKLTPTGDIYTKIGSLITGQGTLEEGLEDVQGALTLNPYYIDFGWYYGQDQLVSYTRMRMRTVKFSLAHSVQMKVNSSYVIYGYYVDNEDATHGVCTGHGTSEVSFDSSEYDGYATIVYANDTTSSPTTIDGCGFESPQAGKYIKFLSSDMVGINTAQDFYVYGDSVPFGAYLDDRTTEAFGALIGKWLGLAYKNKSVSGSAVVRSQGTENGVLYSVTSQLSNFKGIILIAIGQNDYTLNVPLGDVDTIIAASFSSLTPPSTSYVADYTFCEGFRYTIEALRTANPDARIICIYGMNQAARLGTNSLGKYVKDYEDCEVKICRAISVDTIDIKECGIPAYNSSTYYAVPSTNPDGVHPNAFGHQLIARYLMEKVRECAEAQTSFIAES